MLRRIAHVISSPEGVGGAERVLTDLVRGGAERSHEQVVLQLFARQERTNLTAAVTPVPVHAIAGDGVRDLARMHLEMSRTLRKYQPDVVHAHLFHAGVAVAFSRPHTAATLWTHHHGSVMRDQHRRVAAALDRMAARRYDTVVAVSDSVRRFLVEDSRIPPARVHVIRNGWRGSPLPRTVRHGVPVIVTVGMFRPEKDHESLIRAMALLRDEGRAGSLVLVGSGPLRAELETLTDELGLRDVVHFVGPVDDVWPYLAAADVFALASVHEPLGIAVLEAMAAGLPTVTTGVGGLLEVVAPERTGLIVPPRDARALATALATLLGDRDLRERMGAAGRQVAATMRSATMVDSYFELYDELIERSTRRRTRA